MACLIFYTKNSLYFYGITEWPGKNFNQYPRILAKVMVISYVVVVSGFN
jgi:hypothetical protein